ncbi:MAG: DegQ family serine endoprotease [Rhodovibrionaceae bacterium]
MQKHPQQVVTALSPISTPVLARWLLALLVAVSLLCFSSLAQAKQPPESFADLVDELSPTVVNISTTQMVKDGPNSDFEELFREFFERRGLPGEPPQQRERRATSLGSGFIIEASGYIVTNHHVIADADEISVRLHDDTTLEAELVGSDEKTDLALLKVKSDKPLPAAQWGDSDAIRVGDWVLAIGNPFGLGGTVTAGILSARQRDINSGPYDDFLQTDASINRGNSGGPMFDIDGKVIGVNSMIYSPTGGSIGIGFAIPSRMAKAIVDQLKEHGTVKRGWLGVRIQTVTEELAEGMRLEEPRGALVASVTEDGPAEKSGIQQGDVILEFDGREVEDMRKLPRMVAETSIGREVPVVVWRKGERVTVDVELGELDEEQVASLESGPESAEGEADTLGLMLSEITPELRERFELDDKAKGVIVTDVASGSTAMEKGLQAGDIIVEVDQEEVSAPGDVAKLVTQAKEDGYRVVTLLVYRGGDYQWVAVQLEDS